MILLFPVCFIVGFMSGFDDWFMPRPVKPGELEPVNRGLMEMAKRQHA